MQGEQGVPPVEKVVAALEECQSQVDSLKRENRLLRDASRTFGALAERLNQTLESERRLVHDRRGVPRATADRRQNSGVVEPSHT